MNLNVESWKSFRLERLFDIGLPAGDIKLDDMDCGDIPLVSSGESNNGVVGYIDSKGDGKSKIFTGNRVTLDMFCNAFYQENDFYAVSHGRVNILTPKFTLNKLNAIFICSILNKEKYKYSYGRAVYSGVAEKITIKLPIQRNSDNTPYIDKTYQYSDEGYVPDWEFMENYIKSLHHKPLETKNKPEDVPKLDVNDWEVFRVGKLFKVSTTKLSVKDELDEGSIPFISRTSENNGCDGYVSVDEDKVTKGGCLTIGAEGIYCFYQEKPFATGNKVYTLRNENLNPANSLFIATILNKEDYKYSYGRARVKHKLEDESIKLPIQRNTGGTPILDKECKYSSKGFMPDWEYMENYIKSLPYGDKVCH